MQIQAQQNFKIKASFGKSAEDEFSLRFFYGPLLEGGLSLYETFYQLSQLRKPMFSFGFLMTFSKLDIYQFDRCLSKLEQYSLIRVYESQDGLYLFELLKPLYPTQFLKEKVFMDDLKLVLSEEKYQELMVSLPFQEFTTSGFHEITRVSMQEFQLPKSTEKETIGFRIPENLEVYMNRVKPLIFPIQWRSQKILDALSVLQKSFQFSHRDLDKLINKASHRCDQEDQMVSYLYYLASAMDAPKKIVEDPYQLAPVAFYRYLQQRSANAIEKETLIQFVKDMACSNEIMNTIIEWTISQIQDLNLKYLLKVGASVLNRHLDKREEIRQYLNQSQEKAISRRKEKVIPQAKYMQEKSMEVEDLDFDISILKKQIEGGEF